MYLWKFYYATSFLNVIDKFRSQFLVEALPSKVTMDDFTSQTFDSRMLQQILIFTHPHHILNHRESFPTLKMKKKVFY